MVSAFAVALAVDDSDRNFSGAIQSNVLDAVQVMADRLAKLGAPPQALQSALRDLLVRHLSHPRWRRQFHRLHRRRRRIIQRRGCRADHRTADHPRGEQYTREDRRQG